MNRYKEMRSLMNNVNKMNNRRSKRNNVVKLGCVLTGLLVLDLFFKGQIYKRLPTSWQSKLHLN